MKVITLTETEAKRVGQEMPGSLIEIVQECKGRTGKATARRACRAQPGTFIIETGDLWLVAELKDRPT